MIVFFVHDLLPCTLGLTPLEMFSALRCFGCLRHTWPFQHTHKMATLFKYKETYLTVETVSMGKVSDMAR